MAQALELEIHSPGGATRRLRFDAGPITIGRDVENLVVIEGGRCSPRHAAIEASELGWMLSDTSAHGTDYNGVELRWGERVRLSHGDLLKIGDAELTVFLEAPPTSFEQSMAQSGHATGIAERETGPRAELEPAPAMEATTSAPPPERRSALERLMSASSSNQLPPRIHFSHSGEFVRELPLGEEGASILIGRDPECDIVVADPFRVVSKRHSRIYRTWGGVFLEDLSQHGVYLNGERVKNLVSLGHGDRVTLSTVAQGSWGPVLVFLEAADAARAAEAAAFAESRARSAGEDAPRANASRPETSDAASTARSNAAQPTAAVQPPAALHTAAHAEVPAKRRARAPRGASGALPKTSPLILIALGIAGIAVLGLLIGTILFFGKP